MADTKIRVNSLERIEQILQETYDLTVKEINEIQNEMNKLVNSSPLATATFDDKAKYAKAVHDFIKDKTEAIKMRLDIAKFMGEIYKYDGNVSKAINDPAISKATSLNLRGLRNDVKKILEEGDGGKTYNIKDHDN